MKSKTVVEFHLPPPANPMQNGRWALFRSSGRRFLGQALGEGGGGEVRRWRKGGKEEGIISIKKRARGGWGNHKHTQRQTKEDRERGGEGVEGEAGEG